MQITRLHIEDIDQAVELARSFKGESDRSVLSQFLSSQDNYLIGAFDDDRPIGIAIAYMLPRVDKKGPMLYMHEIEIAENYRRQKIGSEIMGILRQEIAAAGFHEMFLITNKSNIAAMRLYESSGGKPVHDDDVVFVFEPGE